MQKNNNSCGQSIIAIAVQNASTNNTNTVYIGTIIQQKQKTFVAATITTITADLALSCVACL